MAYLYRHIRVDKNEPFYIGIGSDTTYKRANEKSRRNNIWKNITAKTEYEVEILFDGESFEIVKEKEKEFIKLYGRIDLGTGTLCNMTDGGDGTLNKVFDERYRQKLSIAAKNRPPQPQVQKIIEWRKANPFPSAETKMKIAQAGIGRKHSEKTIELLRDRKGSKNPMFGKRNYNFRGKIEAFRDGLLVGTFEGVHGCAKSLNITATKISACLNGRRNKTGNYTFKRI